MKDLRFTCRECGADTGICAMDDTQLWCEDCCPDHDYEYEAGERRHLCIHCNAEPPLDWYSCDDDYV